MLSFPHEPVLGCTISPIRANLTFILRELRAGMVPVRSAAAIPPSTLPMNLRSLFVLLTALCLSCALTGCAKKRWWIGKWTFDAEYTSKQIAGNPEPGLGGKLMQDLAPLALVPLNGMEITITDSEIFILRSGDGKAHAYTVVERPSPTSVVLRSGDDLTTYTLQDDRLSTTLTEGLPIRTYFRRTK